RRQHDRRGGRQRGRRDLAHPFGGHRNSRGRLRPRHPHLRSTMPFQINNLSAGFTRPNDTTAYAAGDLVANSTAAGSVVPLRIDLGNVAAVGHGMTRITRARLTKSGTSPTNASFRIHLYETAPTAQNGDNGAWSTDRAASWLGSIDVTSMLAFTDGCTGVGSATPGSEMFLRLAVGAIFALLGAKAAFARVAHRALTPPPPGTEALSDCA